jgi:hypothetical protein
MVKTPQHWRIRPGAPRPGPVVVFDLDGVIADALHRQTLLRREPPDWRGFFGAATDDPVIDSGRALARGVDADHGIVILTARPAYVADLTVEWLDRHDVPHDLLITRPEHDRRTSPDYKRDELVELEEAGYDVRLALDDDPQIVTMYRQRGVFTLYVHSGYYERRDAVASG